MMTTQVHCPYCNASIEVTPEEASRPRLQCPRCGDTFVNRTAEDGSANGSSSAIAAGPPDEGLPAPPRKRLSNIALARLIVGGMVCLAAVGLAYALATVNYRRHNDVRPDPLKPPKLAPSVVAVAPADLAGLGYLPADCIVVGGIHMAQITAEPAGNELLKQLKAHKARLDIDQLAEWVGLPGKDIDHVAFGLRPDDSFSAWLIVHTRQPYSPDALAAALAPAKATVHHGRPVYRPPQHPPARMIWLYDPKTLAVRLSLVGVELTDLDQLPAQPRTGAAGLSAPIRPVLDRLDRESVLWLAGDASKVPWLPLASKLALNVPPALESSLKGIDLFGADLRFYKGLTFDLKLRARDDKAAQPLDTLLRKIFPPGDKTKVTGPDANWLMVQTSMDADKAAQALANLK